jgi:hypothetical protein
MAFSNFECLENVRDNAKLSKDCEPRRGFFQPLLPVFVKQQAVTYSE